VRRPIALFVLHLMTLSPFGCGRAPDPPATPGSGAAPVGIQVQDPVALIKATQEAAKSGGAASGTTNGGTVRVGSHGVSAKMDVPVSNTMGSERAVVSFQGRSLVVDFGKSQVLLDDVERGKLPEGTKDVAVEFLAGKLTVTADGKPVFSSGAP
jgi:hypothetical protein